MEYWQRGKRVMLSLKTKALILVLIVLICIVPLWLVNSNGEEVFGGADSKAEEVVGEVAPNYEVWFEPLFEPPSGEIESLLFALQAALGAGVIGYYVGYKVRGNRDAD